MIKELDQCLHNKETINKKHTLLSYLLMRDELSQEDIIALNTSVLTDGLSTVSYLKILFFFIFDLLRSFLETM